jgi:hypothetical protein
MDEAEARDLVRRELAGYAVDYGAFVERRRRLIGSAWRVGICRVGELAELAGVDRWTIYEDLKSLALPHQWANQLDPLRFHHETRAAHGTIVLSHFRVETAWHADEECIALIHTRCGKARYVQDEANMAELLYEAAIHLSHETCRPNGGRQPNGRDEVFAVRRGERLT